MKYLVGIECEECKKKFFILNTNTPKDSNERQLCSSCLKLNGIENKEVKDSLNDVLSLYKDSPGEGRYKIEEI